MRSILIMIDVGNNILNPQDEKKDFSIRLYFQSDYIAKCAKSYGPSCKGGKLFGYQAYFKGSK